MKPDKNETTKTGTENPPPTEPVHMKGNGENPNWEPINVIGGRKIRYNTTETRSMNIAKKHLRIGNWDVQRLNAPGKIDVLIVSVNIPTRRCCINRAALAWTGKT